MKKFYLLTNIIFFLTLFGVKLSFAQLPVIYSFSPSSGSPGTILEIHGINFKIAILSKTLRPPSDYTAVRFGSYGPYIPSYSTDTYIQITVPNIPVGSYPIIVYNTNGSGQSNSNFSVTPPPPPPITNLAYLHGFNSSSADWQYAQNQFNAEFAPSHTTNNSYNGLAAIGYTATSQGNYLVPYDNTVVLGYSMGGVLAREIKRQRGSNCNIKALISVGSPHTGAPIVNGAQNLYDVVNLWFDDLAAGWIAYAYPYDDAVWIARYYFLGPITDIIYANVKDRFFDQVGLNSEAARDLKPNSSFMNTLNSNPSATLPPPTYAVYGQEDWYSYVRLGDSYLNGGTETGDVLQAYYNVMNYYASEAFWDYYDAEYYYDEYFNILGDHYQDPDYWYMYSYWSYAADQFNWGAYAMNVLHQQDWNYYIVGETLSAQNVADRNPVNDAFIPTASAAPGFIASNRKLIALHTNHAEETRYSESIAKIRYALQQNDINLPRR